MALSKGIPPQVVSPVLAWAKFEGNHTSIIPAFSAEISKESSVTLLYFEKLIYLCENK